MTNHLISPRYSNDDLVALKERQANSKSNRYICIEDKSVLEATSEGMKCSKCSYTLKRIPHEAYSVINKATGKVTTHTRYADEQKHR